MMDIQAYRERLICSVEQVDDIFEGCMSEAAGVFSPAGLDAYIDGASAVCGLGRGTELVLIFLEDMPSVARIVGEAIIPDVVEMTHMLSRSANGKAINPFLASLPAVTRRLEEAELLQDYFQLVERMAKDGSNGLIPMLQNVDRLLQQITIGGLKNWIEYGLRGYRLQPHRIADFFSLQSADSQAALQRERHGTLYVDNERRLDMFLRALWELEEDCHPYSLAFSGIRKPRPFLDSKGFHIPDVYDDLDGVAGIDRYRAMLAHMAAHRCYTEPYIADNFSPFQQLVIETFEDSRVEWLAMQRFPGLRKLWMSLHPIPTEGECSDEEYACIRHKLAMLSRAILDPNHPYTEPLLLEYVAEFHQRMAEDPRNVLHSVEMGREFLTAIHTPSFRKSKVWFKDTEVSYRDDNRYIWVFLEDTDTEEDFHSDHAAANPRQEMSEEGILYSTHHKEWDYGTQTYRPDWVTVYESLHPPGSASEIDKLLEKNQLLAKKLKRIVDLLKPQQHVRIRYQEEGELDLDIAIRSMVDFKSGITPDPRIHMSQKHDGRDIAVLLLLDLSASINEVPDGCDSTVLQLSQEAVSLLAWAIDALGDNFAIAGFASNTRHEVRYLHFKGFNEPWGDQAKGRLAAMEGGYSTRMGSAIRHAGHYLSKRNNDKKLLLVLTDGEPADIDVTDPEYLKNDTKKAVEEISSTGVASYCITLDPNADEYVGDIFGRNSYTVIDHVDKLPEKLPQLFMSLTK